MEPNKREERRRIFRQELFTLKEEGYLSDAIVDTVSNAHHQYHLDLIKGETEQKVQSEQNQQPKVKQAVPKTQKIKKTLSPEAIRERNISWSLNIGVIFLLIGGLFVATSNWESMSSFMKSGSIAIVALIFYGMAFLAKKVLKIEKTAFAFIVLGSLFLPIFILSLGWFGLLGLYLSIDGEGRYILGMLGSFIPIIVYVFFAKILESRLFVWFFYVSTASGAAFMLASFGLSIDYFYLGLMAFHSIMIVSYHRIKNRKAFILFIREFIPYIQTNLIISTLFMLFLYDDYVIYSFNLLLTAAIYLSMMFVSGRKEYHFVFTIMVVYGVYQLIEHSILDSAGAIMYALLGFGFVFVPKVLGGKFLLEKVFQYTSAIISGFAFIYISLEGILLRAGGPSFVMMAAYLIIAGNFLYLSLSNAMRLFPYLSAGFLAAATFQGIWILDNQAGFINFSLLLFLSGFSLFMIFGIKIYHPILKIILVSSRDVGAAIGLLAILLAVETYAWLDLGIMLLMAAIMVYLISKIDHRSLLKRGARWVLPMSFGMSVVMFGEEIRSTNSFYETELGFAFNFAVAGILIFITSFVWNRANEKEIAIISVVTSQMLYTISIAHAVLGQINQLWGQPLVLFAGICLYAYLYKRIGTKWVPYLIGFTTLLLYFSVVESVSIKVAFGQILSSSILPFGTVVLLIIAFYYHKRDSHLAQAFAMLGHIIYPFSLLFTWFAYPTEAIINFAVALFVYIVCTRFATREWAIKLFLYGSFTALFLVTSLGLDLINDQVEQYEFLFTSVLLYIFTLLANQEFKKRTFYYLVPFSFIGIAFTLFIYPFEGVPYLVTILYAGLTLIYLQKIKWDLMGIVPLFLAFIATVEYSFFNKLTSNENMLVAGGIGLLSVLIGYKVYPRLFTNDRKIRNLKIDWYTLTGFLYFLYMHTVTPTQNWLEVLPGMLITFSLWLQRKRVTADYSVYLTIIAGAYLLEPYYSFIHILHFPALWERELIVLPWVAVMILAQSALKGKFSQITKPLQWGVLILVSLLLIQDGLASSTIYDAIILGSLSLASMLAGMFLQIKAYFFVGAGVLLLNVMLQTRPYWGNMPWWGYLLIAGFILITIASTNEWNKQKIAKGESTFIKKLINKMITIIKKWE